MKLISILKRSFAKNSLLSLCVLIVVSTVFPACPPPPEQVFIDNGVVRLGIDADAGGSIMHFSESASNANLLNHFDEGRFIQQSYYGDEDGSVWVDQPWRWNPIQGGDYQGNKPIVLDYTIGDTTLYVKSHPKNWAGGQDMTDCIMEQWITLEGAVAHIRYRFAYTGPLNHAPRHQELPAVFVDANYPHLVYYQGGSPWTNGALTIQIPPLHEDAGNQYQSNLSENWAAYVRGDGYGIGVFTPGTDYMTYYRAGGPGGPTGAGTSYFSPLRTMAVTSGFVFEYDVYLTIGHYNTIRDRFNSLR